MHSRLTPPSPRPRGKKGRKTIPLPGQTTSETMAISRRDMGSRTRSPTAGSRGRTVDLWALFRVGTKVEVSSNEVGFKGAWYSASIYGRPLSGRGRGKGVWVEYDTLLSDANQSEFLIEFVEMPFVRPAPPENEGKAESFQPHDVVDAFHHDGWWKGVVSEVVECPGSGTGNGEQLYKVFFQDPCHQILFAASKLRFHLEWANGSWTKPSKQKRMNGLTFSEGMEAEVNLEKNSSKEVWYRATVVKEVGFCSFLVTCKSETSPIKATVDCFHIRPLPPKVRIKSFSPLESVYAFYESGWRPGFIIQAISKVVFMVLMQNDMVEKEVSLSQIRPYLYWKDAKWHFRFDSHDEVNFELLDKNAMVDYCPVSSSGNGTSEKHHPKLLSPGSNSEKKGVKRSSPGSGARQRQIPKKSKRRNLNVDPSIQREVSSNGKDRHEPETSIIDIDDDIHTSTISELALIARDPAGGASDLDDPNSVVQEEELLMLTFNVPVDKDSDKSETATGKMDDMVQDNELPVINCEKPSGGSLNGGEKLCEPSSDQVHSEIGSSSHVVNDEEIPFTKSALVWETIESMQPFRLFPQKPHFRPLADSPEENREALAISSMVLFASLVERTSKLTVHDAVELLERYMQSLSDLDPMGFNVKPVVDWIKKLLEIKERRQNNEDSLKQLQLKIVDNKTVKQNLVEKIDVTTKKIKELEEEVASDASMVSLLEAEIAGMDSDISTLEKTVTEAEQEFARVVTSLL